MNREIKFRGKRRDKAEWCYGLVGYNSGGVLGTISGWMGEDGGETFQEHEVISESVGQFIGLLDKNGKEIYEGDVMDYGNSRFFYVSYIGCQFMATFNEGNFNSLIPLDKFKVIGNIYENPELLNGENSHANRL